MIIVQKTLNKIILGKQIAILDNPLIFLSIIVIIPKTICNLTYSPHKEIKIYDEDKYQRPRDRQRYHPSLR